jgi:hypothetical protein
VKSVVTIDRGGIVRFIVSTVSVLSYRGWRSE